MTREQAFAVVTRAVEAGHFDDLDEKYDRALLWIKETYADVLDASRTKLVNELKHAYWRACVERCEGLLGDRALAIVAAKRNGMPEGEVES